MRIRSQNISRAKAAAKLISRISSDIKLSQVHAVLSRAMGYRDWHDFVSVTLDLPRPNEIVDNCRIKEVIIAVALELAVDFGDVQDSFARSQLFCDGKSISDALAIRALLHRELIFGPAGRGKPGTVVTVKGYKAGGFAYLRAMGRPAHLLYSTGPGLCADFEVVTPRNTVGDFVPARLWLPYGYWELKDGSTVIFSRDYCPLWRIERLRIERLDPWTWIKGIAEETHFSTLARTVSWTSGDARDLAITHLQQNHIARLPRLVDAMPHLFKVGVETISDAVECLQKSKEPL